MKIIAEEHAVGSGQRGGRCGEKARFDSAKSGELARVHKMRLFVGTGQMRKDAGKFRPFGFGQPFEFGSGKAKTVKPGFHLNQRTDAIDAVLLPEGVHLRRTDDRYQAGRAKIRERIGADTLQDVYFRVRHKGADFFAFRTVGDEKAAAAGGV